MAQSLEHCHALERGILASTFIPSPQNPSDPPDSVFVIDRHGMPWECPRYTEAERTYTCHRMDDTPDAAKPRYFRLISGKFIEVYAENVDDKANRIAAAAAAIPSTTRQRRYNTAAAAAASADGMTDDDDDGEEAPVSVRPLSNCKPALTLMHITKRVTVQPLSGLINPEMKSMTPRVATTHVHDVLFNALHSVVQAQRRGELDQLAVVDRPHQLKDICHLGSIQKISPDYLAGMLQMFMMMLPNTTRQMLKTLPRPHMTTTDGKAPLAGADADIEQMFIDKMKAARPFVRGAAATKTAASAAAETTASGSAPPPAVAAMNTSS